MRRCRGGGEGCGAGDIASSYIATLDGMKLIGSGMTAYNPPN